jgi:undecaprenyl-phosphate 4-deoxy-4-formamido-L-arabinose transferase
MNDNRVVKGSDSLEISFVVPIYNGARMVEALCARLAPVGCTFGTYEIILVDDGSRDDSCAVIRQLQQRMPEVCLVQLSRNFGQHNATLAGLAQARGDLIITLDQDLQHPPEEISSLVEKINEGFDVVYGLPNKRPHSLFRNLTSDFSKWLSRKILATALKGNFSSFRAIRSWVVAEVVQYNTSYIYLDGFISWTTANVGGVTVQNPKSEFESQYTFFKLITHGINLLVNFSIRPLQVASIVGFISSFVGFVLAVFIVINKLFFGEPVQGWTSLIVVVMVLGGAQIAFLGLIGEYIGRILMNTNRAPNYVIREIRRERPSDAT